MLFKFKSIKNKILFFSAITTVTIMLLISLTSYFITKKTTNSLTTELLDKLTEQALNVLKSTMDNSIKNYLKGIAEKNKDIAEFYYNKFKKGEITEEEAKKTVEEIFLSQKIGESGYIYVLNSKAVLQIHPEIKGKDVSDVYFVKKQIIQKEGYLEYMWKNPSENEDKSKALYMVYFKEWDYIISVSSYRSEFNKLVNIQTFREKLISIKVGKTGYPYVVNSKGEVLIHPFLEGKNVLNTISFDDKPIYIMKEIFAKKNGMIKYSWKNENETKIRAKIVYFNYYKEMDLYLVTSSYEDEVFRNVNELKFILNILIILGIIISIVVAILLSKSISKPILKLTENVEQISKNNFILKNEINTNDELNKLSNAFIKMAENIHNDFEIIKKNNFEIENLKNYLSEIIEAISAVLITIDKEGNIVRINKTGKEFLNINENNNLNNSKIWEIKEFSKYKNDIISVITKGDCKLYHKEEIIKDGKKYYYILAINPMNNGDILIKANDITEFEKKDEQIKQMQKMEMIGTLAGGLAHDFNNVLGGITGFISLIKYNMESEKENNIKKFKEEINIIDESAKRAIDMVNRLLSLSRKTELIVKETDLNEIINRVIKIATNTFDKRIEIKSELPKNKSIILADITQIEQMLLNLAINASHAMTIMKKDTDLKGGVLKITLEKIKCDKSLNCFNENVEGYYFLVKISDTGVGIDETIKEKIFEPFFTTKKTGEGTGLGLAMVYNIVKQHKGFIKVYSQLGEGSVFNIFLPEYFSEDKNITENDLKPIKGTGLILVVDDEEIMRLTAKSILEQCGYKVITAQNGFEGINLYNQYKNDIKCVLLDYSMPKLSGLETYKQIKSINQSVKVLLTSGFVKDNQLNECLTEGMNDFIQKPFTIESLSIKINKIIIG